MKSFLFVVDPSWGESRGVVIRDTRVPIVSQLTSHLEQQKVICYYAHCVFAVIPRCAVFPNIYLDMLLLRQRPQGRQAAGTQAAEAAIGAAITLSDLAG